LFAEEVIQVVDKLTPLLSQHRFWAEKTTNGIMLIHKIVALYIPVKLLMCYTAREPTDDFKDHFGLNASTNCRSKLKQLTKRGEPGRTGIFEITTSEQYTLPPLILKYSSPYGSRTNKTD